MKLDLSIPCKDLRQRPITDEFGAELTVGQIIATNMWQDSKNSLKFGEWAPKLWNNEKLDLDVSDKELLKGWIEGAQISNAAKAPALKAISEMK